MAEVDIETMDAHLGLALDGCAGLERRNMKSYNIRVVELDDRDVRLSATNGGLAVELSPETVRVVIKTAVSEAERASAEKEAA